MFASNQHPSAGSGIASNKSPYLALLIILLILYANTSI